MLTTPGLHGGKAAFACVWLCSFPKPSFHFTLDLHAGFVQEADRVAPARPVIPDEMLAALKEEVKMCAG